MDTASLRLFHAVARTGSVVAAAEQVHSVPSNVSARVRKLEEELGIALFLRESRGMRITPAGEVLLDYAERILALTEEARTALRESVGDGGVLRLGSMETTAAVRLPPLLVAFNRARPKVRLSLNTGTSQTQIDALLNRQIDLAFVGGPVRNERLTGGPVFVEDLVLAAPAGTRSVEDTNTKAMLSFRPGCAYRSRTEGWLRARGEAPCSVMEFGTLDGLLGCVAAGMGVTLLPRSVIDRPQHAGQIVALEIPDGRVETWIVQHKDAVETAAMRAFKALLAEGHAMAAE